METRQLILMQGIQASGKSTWSRNWVIEDSQKCVDMWRSLGLLCLQPNSGLL